MTESSMGRSGGGLPRGRHHVAPAENEPIWDVEFPVKLNDDYTCQGVEQASGMTVVFDDLLKEGDVVAKFADEEGNCWGPSGIVVRRDDGLWIEADPTAASRPSHLGGGDDA